MLLRDDESALDQRLPSSIDTMLIEALHLVADTKHYLETRADLPAASAAHLSHLSEFERIAARLGYVVGWLLACKAEHACRADGHLVGRWLANLGADAACMEQPALGDLPTRLRGLLEQSAALYGRAARLATGGTEPMALN